MFTLLHRFCDIHQKDDTNIECCFSDEVSVNLTNLISFLNNHDELQICRLRQILINTK